MTARVALRKDGAPARRRSRPVTSDDLERLERRHCERLLVIVDALKEQNEVVSTLGAEVAQLRRRIDSEEEA
jgi:hypothetical protein